MSDCWPNTEGNNACINHSTADKPTRPTQAHLVGCGCRCRFVPPLPRLPVPARVCVARPHSLAVRARPQAAEVKRDGSRQRRRPASRRVTTSQRNASSVVTAEIALQKAGAPPAVSLAHSRFQVVAQGRPEDQDGYVEGRRIKAQRRPRASPSFPLPLSSSSSPPSQPDEAAAADTMGERRTCASASNRGGASPRGRTNSCPLGSLRAASLLLMRHARSPAHRIGPTLLSALHSHHTQTA